MKVEKMELRLINPNESGFLQHIEWNNEEIRKQVQLMMSAYTNVVYTDDTMKAAKDDRATLNKFKKVIEDRRKEVKKKCMEPYEQFEKEIKEITALIDEPIKMIDGQIKSFEDSQKEQKKAQIKVAYNEAVGELEKDLPFERVFDTRYLNTTFALSKAIGEIQDKISKFKTDIATIDSLDSKHKLNVRDVYMRTLDLSEAMAEDRRLNELGEGLELENKCNEQGVLKAEAECRQKEVEKQLEVTEKQSVESVPVQEMTTSNQPQSDKNIEKQVIDPFAQQVQEKKYRMKFAAIGTREQLAKLTEYMKDNEIEFGKI